MKKVGDLMQAHILTVLVADEGKQTETTFRRSYEYNGNKYDLKIVYAPPSRIARLLTEQEFDIVVADKGRGKALSVAAGSKVTDDKVADLIRMLLKEIDSLEHGKGELNAILDSVSEGIEAIDIHGNIKSVNKAFLKITGMESEDRVGKNIFDVNNDGVLATVLRTQKPVPGNLRQGPGAKREVIATGAPVIKDGNMVGAVIVIKDVSETIRLARDVQSKREMLSSLYTRLGKVNYSFDDISASSKSMREAVVLARKVARSFSTVLIIGESGTGKELFAQAIHSAGMLDNPFIGVNCASIPESLLEGELFGYEKGAFTDAAARKIGLFELAQKGTVFLDEIGDLNLNLQAKLLRVLQEREFRRVGGIEMIPFTARVIAATNRDIAKMIDQGLFRADLYYRLNVMTIRVPPLRERIEDLPTLVEVLLKKVSRRIGKKVIGIENSVVAVMVEYSWPGNVRELENILERAVNVCEGEVIGPEDIEPYIFKYEAFGGEGTFSLELMERKQIKSALLYYGYDLKGKKAAAKALGISLTGLYHKLKKYGIKQ